MSLLCVIWHYMSHYMITYVPRRGAIGSKPIFLYKCVALLGLLWGCCGPLGALKGPLGAQEGSPGPLGGGPKSSPWGVKMLQNHYKTCVILRCVMIFCKILNISLEVLQKKYMYFSGSFLTGHFCDT